MKLLLDEHYSPSIAEQLRKRRHDVVAAAAIPELVHRDDAAILAWATQHGRAIVTENASDYLELHHDYLARSKGHFGIVLTSARRFPRRRAAIGRLVTGLDALLKLVPGDDALRADVRCL